MFHNEHSPRPTSTTITAGRALLALALLIAPTGVATASDPADHAALDEAPAALSPIKEPLRKGNGEKALEAARELADEHAGKPEFQMLYGLAAIEAGAYSEAIMALDAVLIVQPDNHRARLELARAHFHTGNWQSAELHFRNVLDANPPQQVRETVQRFLDRIDARRKRTRPDFQLEGRYSLGHDDNINSATSTDTVELRLFDQPLELDLPEDNTATDDTFQSFGLDGQYRHPINQRRTVSVSANARQLDHFSQDTYDQTRYHLQTSYYQRIGDNRRLRLSANGHQISLDNDSLRWQAGLEGSLEQVLGASNRISASLGLATQRYPDRKERDVDRVDASTGIIHEANNRQYRLSLLGAVESARDSDNEQFGRWLTGLSASISWRPVTRHELSTTAFYRFSRYADDQPLFGERRREHDIVLQGLWQWRLGYGLSLESQVTYQRSESSIEFFEHDRLRGQLGVRYQFFGE